MKKPTTYKDLLELVNPNDLLEVLDFCGQNNNRDKEHNVVRREFSKFIFSSMTSFNEKNPTNRYMKLTDAHYNSIVKCIQDFYWWSHSFNHSFAHIYKRVVNALEIPMEVLK